MSHRNENGMGDEDGETLRAVIAEREKKPLFSQ